MSDLADQLDKIIEDSRAVEMVPSATLRALATQLKETVAIIEQIRDGALRASGMLRTLVSDIDSGGKHASPDELKLLATALAVIAGLAQRVTKEPQT